MEVVSANEVSRQTYDELAHEIGEKYALSDDAHRIAMDDVLAEGIARNHLEVAVEQKSVGNQDVSDETISGWLGQLKIAQRVIREHMSISGYRASRNEARTDFARVLGAYEYEHGFLDEKNYQPVLVAGDLHTQIHGSIK